MVIDGYFESKIYYVSTQPAGRPRDLVFATSLIQSNLDYSKCQGPPDFLRIIASLNFRNRYFSEMFGSFRSVFSTV